ncbi:uncharacterized protein BBOV_IV011670 [Babesia bovis T2Bo]|uniref:Membrane protein, putative n=1 Tax=Babesia bovis TaxID=5865 RepID=A7ASK0_BABBO|nr:uncharacterized protein BBOV_IV011670 [Babesia bovis T2Bo]EDO07519.1 putative integral membrane protein [Babesia bovis T2Bo]|eukprot:XP_001611087.1 hypothetical protein [Babesia bovis T2Bo]
MAGFRKVSACFVGFVAVNYLCQSVMSNDVTSDEAVESTSVKDDVGDDSITLSPLAYSPLYALRRDVESKMKDIDFNLLNLRYGQILDRIVNHVPKDSDLLECGNILKENVAILKKDLPAEFAIEINGQQPGKLSFLIQKYLPLYMAERIASHTLPQGKKSLLQNEWMKLRRMIINFIDDALKTPKMLCIEGKAQKNMEGNMWLKIFRG